MTATAERERSVRPMTFEEAAGLDHKEQPGEIVDGEWVPVTKSTWRHGEITSAINFLLRLYAREHPGWSVSVADPGVKLARNPDRLRGPTWPWSGPRGSRPARASTAGSTARRMWSWRSQAIARPSRR
jgi:Uma2 family endonuclease